MVTSAVSSYLQYSKEINSVKIVCGRDQNLEKMKKNILSHVSVRMKRQLSFETYPILDYFENLESEVSTETIIEELSRKFLSADSIWWVHNYHLGKNPYFTKALLRISETTKQNMVFHIHDFPECSRYSLLNRLKEYIKDDLYPQSDNIKYVVINRRDYNYLLKAGLRKDSLFLLENPIKISGTDFNRTKETDSRLSEELAKDFPRWNKGEPYMLYPVRAIRRKNIAEAALLAVLSDKNVIVTLPGVSEKEKPYSDKCNTIFRKGLAPGMFGIGFDIEKYGISFDELIASSTMIISTSVQEGFGYLFLNSMNWGKPLLAKDLNILKSFKKSFEGFPATFYKAIYIPLNIEQKKELIDLYLKKITSLNQQLSQEALSALRNEIRKIFDSEEIDFSFLTLKMQIMVLEKIKNDSLFRKKCMECNENILKKIDEYFLINISPNHEALEKNWSFKSYCNKSDEIIKSFSLKRHDLIQKRGLPTIFETMKDLFATADNIRLIYDE